MKFSLIPLYEPTAIIKNWRFFIEGIEKIMLHGDDDVSEATILNRLLAGQLLLWICFLDGKYCGFVTTKIDEVPLGKKYLWIVHLYLTPHTPKDVFLNGMEQIEEFAKKYNCDKLKFYTSRDKPFAKRLSELGWHTSYTEFVKEIKGEVKNENKH